MTRLRTILVRFEALEGRGEERVQGGVESCGEGRAVTMIEVVNG